LGREGQLPYAGSMALLAKVLVVSDSVHDGRSVDRSGPDLAARLEDAGFEVVAVRTVADGVEPVAAALSDMATGFAGLVLTTGGTGFSPRDLTPEATLAVIDREAPGLAEAMRAVNPLGSLSRARAGTLGRALIINTPGSPRGALECLDAVLDVLPHALRLLEHSVDDHPPDTGGSIATSS